MSLFRNPVQGSNRLAASLGAVAALSLAPCVHAELFTEDFEGQTVGGQPTGTAVRPTTNSATVSATVVGEAANDAGTGNGLNLLDNDGAANNGFENNFVADTASQVSDVHISFDVARNAALSASTSDELTFAVGAYEDTSSLRLNSSSRRYLEVRFQPDGEFRVDGGNGNTSRDAGELAVGESNTVDLYVNDNDADSLNYLTPNGDTATLAANSFAVYLNGTLVNADDANQLESGALTGDTTLGRAGFFTTNSDTGLDYDVDNLLIERVAVPEPGSMGLLAAGGLLMFRRRKDTSA